jgi:hypothetical protein
MARVEVADFDTWLRVHRANVENRRSFGIVDGPVYRDIDEPNAVLVHTSTDDPCPSGAVVPDGCFQGINPCVRCAAPHLLHGDREIGPRMRNVVRDRMVVRPAGMRQIASGPGIESPVLPPGSAEIRPARTMKTVLKPTAIGA